MNISKPLNIARHEIIAMRNAAMALVIASIVVACDNNGGNNNSTTTPLAACGVEPLFTVAPVDQTQIIGIEPLGHLNPSGHTFPTDHIYIDLQEAIPAGVTVETPVYMPGDAHVVEIRVLQHLSALPPYSDYSVHFALCTEYRASFAHLKTLSNDLLNAIAGQGQCEQRQVGGETFRECNYSLDFQIAAGMPIGTGGGIPGTLGIDFGAIDHRQMPMQWANQTRVLKNAPELPYIACPIDAFSSPLKDELEARFSNYDGTILRTVPPLCGTIAQDAPGTAQGIWFAEGITGFYPEDPNLALVHDNIEPNKGAFSMGPPVNGASQLFYFDPTHSGLDNREFSEVTDDGSIYCYGPISTGAMLVMLDTPTHMLVDFQDGLSCNGGPYTLTAGAAAFER